MPLRKTPLVNNEIYHVFNRSVAQQPIFHNLKEYNLFTDLIDYYRFTKTPLRFSHYSRLNRDVKKEVLKNLYQSNKHLVIIFSFCLMPNHYHILARQIDDKGISNFIRFTQDSYAKYINIKTKRVGSLFQSPFRAVRIQTDEQLLHVARYIHLNPLTSYILKEPSDLEFYQWNSFVDYFRNKPRPFIETNLLMSFFKNKGSLKKFTLDQLDYQRELGLIKHLTFE